MMLVSSMSNILVFDASSSWCSAALSVNGDVFSTAEMQPRQHAQLILPMIEGLCQQAGIKPAGLNGIAYGKGPGSFTGLRIAISVAQGLSLATGAKLYGISSLQALAWQGMKQLGHERVVAIMNAHMGEVFYGAYAQASDAMTCIINDALCKPEDVNLAPLFSNNGSFNAWVGVGDGFQFESQLPDTIQQLKLIDSEISPLAQSMMDLALIAWQQNEFTAAEYQQPVYLRDTVAWKKLSEQPSLLKNK